MPGGNERSGPTAAIGHMPFAGHRTLAHVSDDEARGPDPFLDEWVIAHWPHMERSRCKPVGRRGWYLSRLTERGWQAQFGSYRTYLHNSRPRAWKALEA